MSRVPKPVLMTGPALAGVMGLAYSLGDPSRTQSSSFDAAKDVAPMHVWGIFFLVGCFVMGMAIAVDNYRLLAIAMWVGGAMYVWWASCFGLQAMTDPDASLVAWALYAIIAMIHFVVATLAWMSR